MKNKTDWSWIGLGLFLSLLGSLPANAIELNWSGQFWSEYHFINNYTLDGSDSGGIFDATRTLGGLGTDPSGYYIPAGGSDLASFQTLFLRIRPKLIVNDNIYIKSEWWVGDPVFGLFGSGVPYTTDRRRYDSTFSRGATLSAQRFWGEFLSHVGTFQIGRAPLNWGLGIVWNSGEEVWSRYQSTGDVIRLVSKFGAFSFTPSYVHYSTGNNIGGTCTINSAGICIPGIGNGSVSDYSLILRYENLEEDFEGGVNFIKRLGGAGQERFIDSQGTGKTVQMNYNTWDIYAKKKLGDFSLGGEVPIVSGVLGDLDYSTYALATEAVWRPSDMWETRLRAGHAPGQHNSLGTSFDRYRAFFFHPNYHVGMILFNYQFAHFAGHPGGNTQNTAAAKSEGLMSPWDNPIVNTNYLAMSEFLHTDKWSFNLGLVYARALQAAQSGRYYFNTTQKKISPTPAIKDQSHSLGWEIDWGASFQWDEFFLFRWDFGLYFPGDFYKFSNTAKDNETSTVFATAARVGVTF